jgi:uncharacterized membrane protein (DUF2068 family)
LIALFKLPRPAGQIVVGVGALKLLQRDLASATEEWVELFRLDPNNHYLDIALKKASTITPDKSNEMGLGNVGYAGLFLTEGIGVWFEKPWAEWFTVIITGSLIPIEIYEIFEGATPVKIAVFLTNIAIVLCLVFEFVTRTTIRANPSAWPTDMATVR